MRLEVFCRTSFEGFHCWPDAPDEVGFLRFRHRHTFHVEVKVGVVHGDRDVEFILLKRDVDGFIKETLKGDTSNWSCERWAAEILERFDADEVTVSEDGENGATVQRAGH